MYDDIIDHEEIASDEYDTVRCPECDGPLEPDDLGNLMCEDCGWDGV